VKERSRQFGLQHGVREEILAPAAAMRAPKGVLAPAMRARALRRSGFTLLEAILAMVLMITLMSGVYGFYASTLQVRERGGKITKDAKLAHAILERIADEIRHAADITPGDGMGFEGTHERLVLIRAGMPEAYAWDKHDPMREDLPPAQLDIRRITYELVWDEELTDEEGVKVCHGLLRSDQKSFDPNPRFVTKKKDDKASDLGLTDENPDGTGNPDEQQAESGSAAEPPVDRELVAPEIKYVRFEYFDGAQWRDRWQNAQKAKAGDASGSDNALPQAIRITVGQIRVPPEDEELNINQLKSMEAKHNKEEYHADRFTMVVYLEQADQTLLSSRKYGVRNNSDLEMGSGGTGQ
jgi:hypothetical protein